MSDEIRPDDTELQSTFARVLASEPKQGGIGDLHAEIAVLKSALAAAQRGLAEAVGLLRPFAKWFPILDAEPWPDDTHIGTCYEQGEEVADQRTPTHGDCRKAAELLARHDARIPPTEATK